METLNHLRTSVARTFETFENDIDRAYESLNAELVHHDERARRAEEKARIAEEARLISAAEVQKLKSELDVLRETPSQSDVSSDYIEMSLQLRKTYSPKHVLELNDRGDLAVLEPNGQQWKVMIDKYVSLYNDAQTLVHASGRFREQIRRQKQKLVDWQKCLNRNEFTLTLDGVPVKFKRFQAPGESHSSKAQGRLATATPNPHQHESIKNASTPSVSTRSSSPKENKDLPTAQYDYGPSKHRSGQPSSTETDGFTSTQSASSPIDEGATIGRRTPDESPEQEGRTLKRKRIDLQHIPRAVDCQDNPENMPKVIKSESTLSSSRTFSQALGPIGTQDLDEVGNTVETPTKKKASSSSRHRDDSQRLPLDQTRGENTTPSKWSNILQPVDGNIRPVTGERTAKSSIRSPAKAKRCAISLVAEDGDENYQDFCTRKQPTTSTSEPDFPPTTAVAGSDSTKQRLHDLLDQPFSRRQPLLSQGNSKILSNAQNDMAKTRDTISFSAERSANTSTPGPVTQKNHGQNGEQSFKAPRSAYQTDPQSFAAHFEDERFRNRPLHRLELSNFKINPDYNQGIDFAFSEVVRKKDERKCLSGCMRPGCCGDKFRAMARIGAETCSPAENQKILEIYMGNEKHLLDGLSEEDREKLLHEAKAKSLADSIGKHRHHYQRPNTPPGFWRTDMPDTQELEDDREEAKVREREKVKDRYREAMRPGGLWKFADE